MTVDAIDDIIYRHDTEQLLGFIRHGDLVKVDGKYRVTDRGYRTVARYFRLWLRSSKFNDDLPPHNINLLFIDGCTDVDIFAVMHSCSNHCRWKRLHKVILDTVLSDNEKALLNIKHHTVKSIEIPSWCPDLVSEMVKDAQELSDGTNRLIEDGWGRTARVR